MKIVTIVGARPQFIKAAAVSRAIARRGGIDEVIVHTGQHFDANMSQVFFDELDIPAPDTNLEIGGLSHGAMTGRQLEAIEAVLMDENPDWVLVYGDTNSTLAGALAAAKLHIRVAHVEAGLRSFNRRMPEEINRILTDHAVDLLLAPTETAVANLSNEGISDDRVRRVGDVMQDVAIFYSDRAREPAAAAALGLDQDGFVLATVHRAENTDDPERLRAILQGLGNCGMPVLWPVHPRTRAMLVAGDVELAPSIHPIDPVGYLEMVWLEKNCRVVATDSGGVQKEAYFHRKPCVTLRNETEWVELVETGWNRVVGTESERVARAISSASSPDDNRILYGDGNAAELIVAQLRRR